MSDNHESWLRKKGVRITGRRTLRRASALGYMNYSKLPNEPIDFTTTEEQVYTVELDERTIERLERMESTVKYAFEAMDRKHGGQRFAAPSHDIADYYIENKERHLELLQENSMYQDAWKEFQSIRALLGETPHWP